MIYSFRAESTIHHHSQTVQFPRKFLLSAVTQLHGYWIPFSSYVRLATLPWKVTCSVEMSQTHSKDSLLWDASSSILSSANRRWKSYTINGNITENRNRAECFTRISRKGEKFKTQTSRRLPGGERQAHFPKLETLISEWVQIERNASETKCN